MKLKVTTKGYCAPQAEVIEMGISEVLCGSVSNEGFDMSGHNYGHDDWE